MTKASSPRKVARLGFLAVVLIASTLVSGRGLAATTVTSTSVHGSRPVGTAWGTDQADSSRRSVRGTVVRFKGRKVKVDVTITVDSRASRDFVSMLPLRLTFEDFAGSEKISYLPRRLKTRGVPGGDPENGDFYYYRPWGNIIFYYDATGVGHSPATLELGSYTATPKTLRRLQRGQVTVKVVARP